MIDEKSIDWKPLYESAKSASEKAYAPYSEFSVGAAAYAKDGTIYSGCNVENASYGLTLCAERNCLTSGVTEGNQEFTAILIYTHQTTLTPPCGACRQFIAEFLEQDALVASANHLGEQKIWRVSELLPEAFTPKNLQDKD